MNEEALEERLLNIAARAGGPLLALDTSGPRAALCTVGWGSARVEEVELDAASMPSESLASALAERLEAGAVQVAALRAIVVGIGPGSYTGLRVGLATAKGLAFGGDVPLFGISSLALLAASSGAGYVAVAADARVGEVFAALYRVSKEGAVQALLADRACTPQAWLAAVRASGVGPARWVGSGARSCLQGEPLAGIEVIERPVLRTGFGILHAAERIIGGHADALDDLAPRYLRVSEAERQCAGHPSL